MSQPHSLLNVGFAAALLVAASGCGTLPGGADGEFAEFDFGSLTSPQEISRYLVVNVGDRVFFGKNSSGVDSDSQELIRKQVSFLNQNPTVTLTVEGHCDERGTREYNLALGLRRANALREALIAAGLEANRVQVVSYGKERPVAGCSRERCWKVNRRSVIVVDNAEEEEEGFEGETDFF